MQCCIRRLSLRLLQRPRRAPTRAGGILSSPRRKQCFHIRLQMLNLCVQRSAFVATGLGRIQLARLSGCRIVFILWVDISRVCNLHRLKRLHHLAKPHENFESGLPRILPRRAPRIMVDEVDLPLPGQPNFPASRERTEVVLRKRVTRIVVCDSASDLILVKRFTGFGMFEFFPAVGEVDESPNPERVNRTTDFIPYEGGLEARRAGERDRGPCGITRYDRLGAGGALSRGELFVNSARRLWVLLHFGIGSTSLCNAECGLRRVGHFGEGVCGHES